MKIKFHSQAFSDYNYFRTKDVKIFTKINKLLEDICNTPFTAIGKPEALRHNLSGFWSRRITSDHRLVYTVENDTIYVLQCRYHY